MSAEIFSNDSTLKTTTVARVNASGGPAVATAVVRKNRRSMGTHIISYPLLITHSEALHSTEVTGDALPVVIPVLHTLTMITVSVPAEAVCVDNTDVNTPIVPHSPSGPSGSPPRFSIPTPARPSHSEGTTPTPHAPSPPPQTITSSLVRAIIEAERSNHPTGNILRHSPLEK